MTAELERLTTVITVGIEKGGVGKTSIISNLGGVLASLGHPTLIVVLDPQDNEAEDLGYGARGDSDDGANLAAALLGEEPLIPLGDVRPNLDVATAGHHLEQFLEAGGPVLSADALAKALEPVASDYDFILIDTPPSKGAMATQALTAAKWLLVPTKVDASSRKGIRTLATNIAQARIQNPHLRPLGVVMFAVSSTATRVKENARADLEHMMQGTAPVYRNAIRHADAVAFDARERGLLAYEAAAFRKTNWKKLMEGKIKLSDAAGVAADYVAVAEEMLDILASANDNPGRA